jgi:hypothetical protein
MKTMYKGLVNSPETTITNNIGTNDTIIYVLDPARVPSDLPNLMVLGTGTNAETIKVTAIEGNALTVERGFQGIAKDWLAGTIIARNFTEYDHDAFKVNIEYLATQLLELQERTQILEQFSGDLSNEFTIYHKLYDHINDLILDSNGDSINARVIFVTK